LTLLYRLVGRQTTFQQVAYAAETGECTADAEPGTGAVTRVAARLAVVGSVAGLLRAVSGVVDALGGGRLGPGRCLAVGVA
jgi:hypothetical protein